MNCQTASKLCGITEKVAAQHQVTYGAGYIHPVRLRRKRYSAEIFTKMAQEYSFNRTAARLLANNIRYRFSRLTGSPLSPEVVSLAVTGRCNSHCIMCNIWRKSTEDSNNKFNELSGDEIEYLLSNQLFSGLVELDITGGEPHLRDDLADIIIALTGLKKSRLPRLKSIVITSNGLMTEKIVSNYSKILEAMRNSGTDLVNVASLDGIGEIHDRVRGTKGAFERAAKTLEGLLELRRQYTNYYIGIKTTVLPDNVEALEEILEFAREKGLFHIISPAFFTETRFKNTEKENSLKLKPSELETLTGFYRRPEFDTNYFYSRIRGLLFDGHKRWSCSAAYNYLFIEADGTVYPCELLSGPIGNIREQRLEEVWNSKLANRWRKRIGKEDRCRACIEPGAVRYSACAEGLRYFRFLADLGRRRYRESLYNEGFIKYFPDTSG